MPHADYAGPSTTTTNPDSLDYVRIRALAERVGWLSSLELQHVAERALRYQGRFGNTKGLFWGDEWLELRARQLEAIALTEDARVALYTHFGWTIEN